MDKLKLWLINIGVKQMGPSLIRAAVAFFVASLAAHQGMLETFGVVYDKTANTLTLHIGALQTWLLGGGLGLITALLTAAQHHTLATVTGTPQTGVKSEPTAGGERVGDPPLTVTIDNVKGEIK